MIVKEKTPKSDLLKEERELLRKNKNKLSQIKILNPDELCQIGFEKDRAKELIALSLFQSIPSVGPGLANNVVNDLGYDHFEEIRGRKEEDLILELEKKYGVWMDPCVEDGLRCVVHHANYPDSDKNWLDFTE